MRRAFTFAEFLVTLMGLALIAGFVFVHIAHQRNMTTCLNNLKQIGLAQEMYTSEGYWGELPRAAPDSATNGPDLRAAELGCMANWDEGLVPPSVLHCPFDANWTLPENGRPTRDEHSSYGWWDTHGADGSPGVASAANMIVSADEPAKDANGNPTNKGCGIHDDGQAVLYKDVHVKFVKTVNPDDDADPGGIYEASGPLRTDTRIE